LCFQLTPTVSRSAAAFRSGGKAAPADAAAVAAPFSVAAAHVFAAIAASVADAAVLAAGFSRH